MKALLILIMVFIFISVSTFVSFAENKKDSDKSNVEGTEKAEKTKEKSLIDKTLEKIPPIKSNVKKEEITTRHAAVTRANKQTKEKLPLIWKLDKEQPPSEKSDQTEAKKSENTPD